MSGQPGGYYPTTSQTSGSSTTTSSSEGTASTTPSAAAYQAYYNALQNAANVAATPYEPYQGGLVAPMTPDQIAAFQGYQNAVNMQQPYITGAQNLYNQAFQYSDPNNYFNQIGNYYDPLNQIVNPYLQQAAQYQQNQFDLLNPINYQAGIQTYSNPYQQQVVDATMGQLGQLQNQLMGKNTADAVRRGVYGGSGQFMGEAEIARQQGLSNAQTLAQLNAQNYENAQRQYNAQQALGITSNQQALANALQQAGLRTGLYNQAGTQYGANRGAAITGALSAAQGLGGLGSQAQTGALQGLSALLQSGTLQQQQGQNALNAAYNQWLQAKAFPYQQASYYSGLVSGVAPLMGAYQNQASSGTGTTNYSGSTINMQPYASQSGGGGIFGALTAGAGILGDILKLKTGGRAVSKEDRKHYAYGGGEDSSEEQTDGVAPIAVKTTNISLGGLGELMGKKPYEKGINPEVTKAAELFKLIPRPGETGQEKLAEAIKKAIETRTANLNDPPKPEAPSGIKSSADWFGGGDSGGGILGSLGNLASSYLDSKKSSGSSESSSSIGGGFFDSMKDFFKADGGRVGYADGGGKTISQLMDEQSSLDLNKKLGAGIGNYDQLLAQAKSKGSGPQKTPVQQGRVAMPDSVYYRKRLPTYGFTSPTATTTDTSGTIGPSMSSQLEEMQKASNAGKRSPRTGDPITFPDSAGVYAGTTITPAQKDIMNAAYLDQYAFINDMYSQYLGRRPTAAEAQKWVAAMGAGGAGTPGTGTAQQEYGTLPSNLTPMQVQNWFASHSTERINALKPVVQGYYQQIGSGGINPETGMPDINYVGEYYSPGYTSQLSDVSTTSDPYFNPYAPGVPESAHAEGAVIPNIPGKTDQFGNPIKKNKGGRVGRAKGGSLSSRERLEIAAKAALQAGASPKDAAIMAAIAMPESGGNLYAHNLNPRTGDNSYGLWQVNMLGGMGPERRKQFGLSRNEELFDPLTNAKAALKLMHGRGGLENWSTYRHGAHKPYYSAAVDVVNNLVKNPDQIVSKIETPGPLTLPTRGGAPNTSSMMYNGESPSQASTAPESDVEKPKSFGELLAKVAADVGKKQETEKESPAPEMAKLEVIEPPKSSGPTLADLQQISMAETPMKLGRSKGGRLHFQDGGSGWLDTLFGSEANPATRDYKTRAELSSPEEEAAYAAGASAAGIPGLDYARTVLRGLRGEVSGADMGAFGQRYKEEMARHNARMQEAERLKREYPEAYRGGHLAASEYAPGAEAGFFAQPGLASAARGAVQRSFKDPIYRASNAAFERVNPNVKYDFGNITEGSNPALKVRDNSQGWNLYDRPAYNNQIAGMTPQQKQALQIETPNWRMQGPTQQQNVVDLHQQRLADINAGLNPKLRTPAAKFLGTNDMGVNMSRAQNIDPALVNAIAERQGAKGALGHAYATGRLGEINPITGAQEIPGGFVPKDAVRGRRDFTAAERANVMPGSTNKLEAQYVRGIKGLGKNYTPPTQGMNYEDYGKVPLKAHELRRAANQNLGPVSQEAIDELEAFRSKGTPSRAPFRPTDFEGGVEASPREAPNLFKPKDTVRTESSTENMAPGSLNFGVVREGYQAPTRRFTMPDKFMGMSGNDIKRASGIGAGLAGMSFLAGYPAYTDGLSELMERRRNKQYVSPLTGDPKLGFQELVQYPDQKVDFPTVYGSVNPSNFKYPTEPSMNPERQEFRQAFNKIRQPTTTDFMGNKPRVVADESATRPSSTKSRKAKSATPKAKSSESGEKYWGDWRDAPGFSEDPIGNFFDSLMGETKSSSKKGHLANGGMARRGYNKGGQPMDLDPLSAIGEGLGSLGNAIGEGLGGLFGQDEAPAPKARPVKAQPKEKVVADDAAAKPAAPVTEAPKMQTPSLFGEGKPLLSPSVSNALIAAGLGMMASPARDPLRAIGEGGLMGFKYYQAAAEEERKRQQLEEQFRQAHKFWDGNASLGDLEPKTVASDEESPVAKPTAPIPGVTTPTVPAGPKTPTAAPTTAPTAGNIADEISRLIDQHTSRLAKISSYPVHPENTLLEKQKQNEIKSEETIIKRLEQRLKDQQEKEKTAREEREKSPSGRGEEAFAKKMAEDQVKEITELRKQAPGLDAQITDIDKVLEALRQGKVYHNPMLFEAAKGYRNLAADIPVLGGFVGSEDIENTERLNALATKDLLQQIGGSLGSQISDADRATIERAAAQVGKSDKVNIRQLEVLKAAMQRAKERSQLMKDYAKNHDGSLYGYLEYEAQNLNHSPIYDEKTYREYNVDPRTSTYNPGGAGGAGGEFDSLDAEMRRRGLLK